MADKDLNLKHPLNFVPEGNLADIKVVFKRYKHQTETFSVDRIMRISTNLKGNNSQLLQFAVIECHVYVPPKILSYMASE